MEAMKKYLAEAIGTLTLVFMGCGSAMVVGVQIPGGHLAVALCFGLAIIATAYVIGGISGCHLNPAVSLAMLINKRLSGKDFVGYVIAQIIGAIGGAALLKLMTVLTMPDLTGAFGANSAATLGIGGSIAIEIILTFFFVFVILGVTADSDKSSVAGLVIGLSLVFVHIVGIPLTGTSVNPARSIGPAIFAGGEPLASLWVFIVAPLVGAAIAALLYGVFYKNKKAPAKKGKK